MLLLDKQNKYTSIEAMKIVFTANDLIKGFRSGDEAAIRHLYDLHYRPLCYFADKLINDKTEAEDIAVDSFLKLLAKKNDFNKLEDIKAFLFTVARNACFDFLRRLKLKDKVRKEFQFFTVPEDLFAEKEMLTSMVLQIIYEEIENMPVQCKKVFKSIFIEGKKTSTIANEMGISNQTVLNQKAKALQTLRLKLYKEEFYSALIFLVFFFFLSICY